MPWTKEEKNEYNKWYNQTPKGKKTHKMSDWKRRGLIWTTQEEIDEIYNRYLNSKYCEIFVCSKEYKNSKDKHMDHDHQNGKYGPFRNVLCKSCNSKMRDDNTSGIPNIYWNKQYKGWEYQIEINGQKHSKKSKDKDWLLEYKKDYEQTYLYI